MANITYIPYAQQQAAIDRQRKYAELMQQQATEPLESQQVSGIVVPTSPWLGLAKMLQAGLGGYAERKAGEQEAALKKQSAEEAKKYFTDLATYAQKGEKTGETPITTEISGYGATQPLPVLNVQDGKFSQAMKDVYTPATKAGMLARMMEGMSSENPDIAKYVSAYGSALMPTSPEIGAVNPADWTPESLAAYKASGKYSDLVPVTKAKTPTTFEQEWELFKKDNPQGTLADFKKLSSASTNVNVALPPAQGEYAKEVGTSLAKREDAILAASETAPDQIASAQRIRGLLQQSPITGAGAEFKLGAKKLAVIAGLADPNDNEIVATDKLISELAKGTLSTVKSSGLGAGNGFTDKDLAFLEKATTGNVELSSKTLEYLAEKNERAAREAIKKGNVIRARRRSMPEFKGLGGAFEDIPMPAEYNPTTSYGTPPAGAVRPRG